MITKAVLIFSMVVLPIAGIVVMLVWLAYLAGRRSGATAERRRLDRVVGAAASAVATDATPPVPDEVVTPGTGECWLRCRRGTLWIETKIHFYNPKRGEQTTIHAPSTPILTGDDGMAVGFRLLIGSGASGARAAFVVYEMYRESLTDDAARRAFEDDAREIHRILKAELKARADIEARTNTPSAAE